MKEWEKFYQIKRHLDYVVAPTGDIDVYVYDVFDVHTGELVGTFVDEQDLAESHAEELYKIRMEEIERIILKQ